MVLNEVTPPAQLNIYKQENLTNTIRKLLHSASKFQTNLALSVLHDWSWTRPRKALSLLQYNIQHFYANQCDLVDMIEQHAPLIISLNELGTKIPPKTIQRLLFAYSVYQQSGTNPHGGAVLAIDKCLKAEQITIADPNIAAALGQTNGKTFVIASIYSPPTESLPLHTMSSLLKASKNIIIAGDLNAEHSDWGCTQTNTKGRQLAEWLHRNELEVLNHGMKTSLRPDTTIDLIISPYASDSSSVMSLPFQGSDHLPVFAEFAMINVSGDDILVPKTYWDVYASVLEFIHDQIDSERKIADTDASSTSDWFIEFQSFLSTLKYRVTVWQSTKRKRPSLSNALRTLLEHKHHLQNRYRHTRLESDRLRLRSWSKLVQSEFTSLKQKNWNSFISNVASPNPMPSTERTTILFNAYTSISRNVCRHPPWTRAVRLTQKRPTHGTCRTTRAKTTSPWCALVQTYDSVCQKCKLSFVG